MFGVYCLLYFTHALSLFSREKNRINLFVCFEYSFDIRMCKIKRTFGVFERKSPHGFSNDKLASA